MVLERKKVSVRSAPDRSVCGRIAWQEHWFARGNRSVTATERLNDILSCHLWHDWFNCSSGHFDLLWIYFLINTFFLSWTTEWFASNNTMLDNDHSILNLLVKISFLGEFFCKYRYSGFIRTMWYGPTGFEYFFSFLFFKFITAFFLCRFYSCFILVCVCWTVHRYQVFPAANMFTYWENTKTNVRCYPAMFELVIKGANCSRFHSDSEW